MEIYYSNSQPNLVSDHIYTYFNSPVQIKNPQSFHIGDFFCNIYNTYIYPNVWTILIILVIVLFVYYRYKMKKQKDYYTTSELEGQFYRPTFNPFYSVDKQINYSLYPPKPITTKVLTNDKNSDDKDSYKVTEVRDIYNPTDNYPTRPAQDFGYMYPNYGWNQPPGPQYSGTGSLYEKDYPNRSVEFSIPNPLGFPSDFNETTGQFINGSTELNKRNLVDYCDGVKQEKQSDVNERNNQYSKQRSA